MELDRKELKIQALKQKNIQLEDAILELRVELTVMEANLGEAQEKVDNLQSELDSFLNDETVNPDVVESEVQE